MGRNAAAPARWNAARPRALPKASALTWIAVLLLAAAALLLMARIARLPAAAWQGLGAIVLLGLAGYGLIGRPDLPGAPTGESRARVAIDENAITLRNEMGSGFGRARNWLVASDGALRAGLPGAAVTYIRSGIREDRDSADLWLGLGNALVIRADGQLTPAARMAYAEAARLDPRHPGPPFFLGTMELSAGDVERARALWTRALSNSPPDARWRPGLAAALAELPPPR